MSALVQKLPCLQAHPPIHPTKHTAGEHSWNTEKARLYEFIVRSFLATCSKAAVGFETRLEIRLAGEGFSTTGMLQPVKHVSLLSSCLHDAAPYTCTILVMMRLPTHA